MNGGMSAAPAGASLAERGAGCRDKSGGSAREIAPLVDTAARQDEIGRRRRGSVTRGQNVAGAILGRARGGGGRQSGSRSAGAGRGVAYHV